jgi:DtxR family Mn-dependent transcriptional regulator
VGKTASKDPPVADVRLTDSQEDYLEAIYTIVEEKQAVRAKDISRRLKVNNSSVTGALKSLSEKGLVNYAPYDVITLTAAGRTVAAEVTSRHVMIRRFFVDILGIPEAEAETVACKVEHALSDIIAERLARYIEYTERCPVRRVVYDEATGFRCISIGSTSRCRTCTLSAKG